MNLKPLGDRVILKQDEAEETTASGLFIASSNKEKPTTGKIVAVGEGKHDSNGHLIPIAVKEGDRVVYSKYAGNDISVDGEDYVIVKADDIYAVYGA
jgi:chaperonin GroES